MPEKNRRLGLSKSRYILLWYKTFSQYLNFFWVTNVCFFNLQVKVKLLEVILKNHLEHFSNNLKDTDLELELKQDLKDWMLFHACSDECRHVCVDNIPTRRGQEPMVSIPEWISVYVWTRNVDPDPHSFSLLDPDPHLLPAFGYRKEKYNEKTGNARK